MSASSTLPQPTAAAAFPGERPVTPEVVREHNLNELEYGCLDTSARPGE